MAKKKTTSSRKRSRPVSQKKNKLDKNMVILAGIAVVIVVAVAAIFLIGGWGANDTGIVDENDTDNDIVDDENPIAIIDTTMGTIIVELFQDKVPNTVENFISYADDGFYEGLVFHRVIEGFMIQGGGFYPDGTRKETRDPINLEIHPDVRHVDGAIAMARTQDPNSATSQFYICHGPQSSLDDNYAAFGITIEGFDIISSIASVDTTTKNGMQDWPVTDVIINSITIEQ